MSCSAQYWKLVNSLIERGITSEDAWYYSDRAEYFYYLKRGMKGFRVGKIIKDVVRHTCNTRTLYDFIIKDHWVEQVERNPVYKLLRANNFDPAEVGTVLVKWSGLISARNTVCISGGDNTGARWLADAIAFTAPMLGVVRSDRAQPFYGCDNCNLILWREAPLDKVHADVCKRVLSGTHVPKGHEYAGGVTVRDLYRTPVLVNINHGADVFNGNHRALCGDVGDELENVAYRLHLFAFWDPEPITCNDVRDFLTWSCDHKVCVQDRFDLTPIRDQ